MSKIFICPICGGDMTFRWFDGWFGQGVYMCKGCKSKMLYYDLLICAKEKEVKPGGVDFAFASESNSNAWCN